jgi:hypothetical protein
MAALSPARRPSDAPCPKTPNEQLLNIEEKIANTSEGYSPMVKSSKMHDHGAMRFGGEKKTPASNSPPLGQNCARVGHVLASTCSGEHP